MSTLPLPDHCLLTNITVPAALITGYHLDALDGPVQDGLARTTIGWAGGQFLPMSDLGNAPKIDASGLIALPLLAEAHVHLDKTRTISATGFSDGTLMGAIQLLSAHMMTCDFDDVLGRMRAAAEEACARGVRVLRTHIDCFPLPENVPAWHAAKQLRQELAPHLTLQFATLSGITRVLNDDFEEHCRQIAAADGILGAFVPPGAMDPALLDSFLNTATRFGLDVDFHIDEGLDAGVCNVVTLARSIARTGYQGRVVAGHCCSLSVLPADEHDEALDLIATSGMAVVTLPQTNLFLQDRTAERTPRHRGLTLIHELRTRGVPVAIGTDNIGDAFYPFGDYDLLDLFSQNIAAAHLDGDLGGWLRAITDVPARAMGITDAGRIAPGHAADLMLLPARDWTGIIGAKPEQRQIIHRGVPYGANTLSHLSHDGAST
jgi:cytosine deaminase